MDCVYDDKNKTKLLQKYFKINIIKYKKYLGIYN